MPVDPEVKRRLDAVVGDSYAPPRRWRASLGKWALAAVLAIGTSFAIVTILNTHVVDAQKAPGPKKPVAVTIVPAQK